MKIVIPEWPEKNYNISEKSQLIWWMKLLWTFFAIIFSFYLFFLLVAHYLVYLVPLEKEIEWFWEGSVTSENIQLTKKINEIFPDIKYSLHVISSEEENAYAKLWWKILVTEWLLNSIEYENELLMIIWHEISHIENRDVFKKIVSEFPIQLLLLLIWFSWNEWLYIFDSVSSVYNKEVEERSDFEWVDFVNNEKNHIGCITRFFEKNNDNLDNIVSFLSDHPMTASRITEINEYAQSKWFIEKECSKFEF